MADRIRVEVAYVEPGRQFLQALSLPMGSTVGDAMAASDLQRDFPDLDVAAARVGVFSRPATRDTPLRDGDRVEVYRALIANPKEVRRQRAVRTAKT
jgi:uncharacterized protein